MSFFVLCSNSTAVSAVVKEMSNPNMVTVKYMFHKVEHVVSYVFHETFSFPQSAVNLYVPQEAASPCLLLLPSPFNQTLKLGDTLLFQVCKEGVDFVSLWNSCCDASVTWQHHRPKKTNDPLQKLGLPAKLTDFLKEQVALNGQEVPYCSEDDEEEDVVAAVDEKESSYFSSSDSSYDTADEDYYSTGNLEEDVEEDLEEEEEAEEDQEPELEEDQDDE